jgi:hypothetical protein
VVRGSDVRENSGWYRPEDLIPLASRWIYASFIPVFLEIVDLCKYQLSVDYGR